MTSNGPMTEVKAPGFRWNKTKGYSDSWHTNDGGYLYSEPSLLIPQLSPLSPHSVIGHAIRIGVKKWHLLKKKGFSVGVYSHIGTS